MHLNRQGIKPPRSQDKAHARHARPAAVIFTDGVLKDLLKNQSYLGKVLVDGQLIDGQHPALIDAVTWDRCQANRLRNRRRTSNTWTRYSYPLTPVLACGRCGGRMHGEMSRNGGRGTVRLYYGCTDRRRWLARNPDAPRCNAPWVRAVGAETALRDELRRCLPSAELNEAYRERLRQATEKARDPQKVTAAAVKRLDQQLARAQFLFELGEYDQETFMGRRGAINQEKLRLREQAATHRGADDFRWRESQIVDLIQVWEHADASQRARLIASIFERIEADTSTDRQVKLVAVPRADWKPFFERVVHERETRLELATSTLGRSRSTN